jgi:hypothetical protein
VSAEIIKLRRSQYAESDRETLGLYLPSRLYRALRRRAEEWGMMDLDEVVEEILRRDLLPRRTARRK